MQELLTRNGLQGAYPSGWDRFVGQTKAKRMIQVAALAAKMRGDRLGHMLLASGAPGLGKTTLALLAGAEMSVRVRIVSGRMTVENARIALARLNDHDILVIDEIHRMVGGGKQHAEWLLHLLTDGVIIGPTGPEPQPNITVIGTTTDAGVLPDTLLSRFMLRPELVPYSDEEALQIALYAAAQVVLKPLPFPSLGTLQGVARAASNNPRLIGQILANVRDIALVDGQEGEDYDLTEPLNWLGLEPDGITALGVRYLQVLVDEFGGTAGATAMVDRLQEPGGLHATERLLIEKSYIRRTKRGRSATQDGIRRVMQ